MCPLHYIFSKDFYLDNKFGKSSGPVWLEKLSCTGTEHDITACLLDWKTQSCSNQSAVGLSCGKYSFLHTHLYSSQRSNLNQYIPVCEGMHFTRMLKTLA